MKLAVYPLRDANYILRTSDILRAYILQDKFTYVFLVDDEISHSLKK
jgi:hypothetical protein